MNDWKFPTLDLAKMDSPLKREKLESFILEQSYKAKQCFDVLEEAIKPVCYSHGGVAYQQEVRVNNKQQEQVIEDVILATLPVNCKDFTLDQYCEAARTKRERVALEGLISHEQAYVKEQIRVSLDKQ